jgi:hypothetical protein
VLQRLGVANSSAGSWVSDPAFVDGARFPDVRLPDAGSQRPAAPAHDPFSNPAFVAEVVKHLRAEAQRRPGVLEVADDAVKGAKTGVMKSTAGLLGAPAAIGDGWHAGWEWIVRSMQKYGEPFGLPPAFADEIMDGVKLGRPYGNFQHLPTADKLEAQMGPMYHPKYTPGQWAETTGELVPGALVFGGNEKLPRKLVNSVLIPGSAEERIGRLLEGTPYEKGERIDAAIQADGAASLLNGPKPARNLLSEIVTKYGHSHDLAMFVARVADIVYQHLRRHEAEQPKHP